MKLVVLILAVVVLALSATTAYQFSEIREQRAAIEASDVKQSEALRTILCLAQRNTLTSRQRTSAEKAAIVKFYREALREIDSRPCDPVEVKQ